MSERCFYSISEVAEMFNVNISKIRFWEKEFDILKPHKNKKGNRLFTPKDIDNLNLIFFLLKEKGLTIKGAKKKLKENSKEVVDNYELIKKLQKIKEELLTMKENISNSGGE